jgi:hypothetical protein
MVIGMNRQVRLRRLHPSCLRLKLGDEPMLGAISPPRITSALIAAK